MDHDKAAESIDEIFEKGDRLLQALIENVRERKKIFRDMTGRCALVAPRAPERSGDA
ncbi:hypothetical protein GRI33_06190 [Brucella sp. BO3]|uniref:hypothetical protein n=1 Tax=unclassified Brucella TaxID=2632610 RepID=UPI00159F0C9D|nr:MULTISPECIES: hypothetical protein [unclassified Brucella]QMV26539.1 hypothetical protein GRI33_06190 [Brucella sp. BO3]